MLFDSEMTHDKPYLHTTVYGIYDRVTSAPRLLFGVSHRGRGEI